MSAQEQRTGRMSQLVLRLVPVMKRLLHLVQGFAAVSGPVLHSAQPELLGHRVMLGN